jgi:hypothetical protein
VNRRELAGTPSPAADSPTVDSDAGGLRFVLPTVLRVRAVERPRRGSAAVETPFLVEGTDVRLEAVRDRATAAGP